MRRLIYASFMLAVCSGPFAFGQVIQTGFGVVTPVAGNGQGLQVAETFSMVAGGNIFQSSVPPSPLITLSNMFINWDVIAGIDTGIAIVNTNDRLATVTLNLLNEQGARVATRTLLMAERQQDSFFATQLFAGVPELSRPFAGLLLIGSTVPVGVLALAFNGLSFNSLPVSGQLGENNVVTAGTFAAAPGTPVPPAAPVTNTISPPTVPISSVPPPTIVPTVEITTTLGNTIVPVPPTPLIVITNGGDLTVPGGQFATPSSITEVINATGGFLLPQVASGGGWVSQIMIGNTSPVDQIVRVDFFDSTGTPMLLPGLSTGSSLVVPAGGVVVLSTTM